MSGFERAEGGSAWTEGLDGEDSLFPDDFSSEEADFASELRMLFPLEHEQLPPLYTQTLLDDIRITSAEPGFEQKMTYRVMRRLSLQRSPLFERHRVALRGAWRESLTRLSRPIAAMGSVLLVLMALSMALTSPAFADGLRVLTGQSGVAQVQRYPDHVSTPTQTPASRARTLLTLDESMPLAWLGTANGDYLYRGVRLEAPRSWSKGPIVDMQYQWTGAKKSTGVLDVREFRVSAHYAAVLQVVGAGSASLERLNGGSAVYVDGAWMPVDLRQRMATDDAKAPYVWQTGTRSELIFERAGVVFWIVGDQHAGMGKAELLRLARLLTPTTGRELAPDRMGLRLVGDTMVFSYQPPIGKEVYQVIPRGVSTEAGAGEFITAEP